MVSAALTLKSNLFVACVFIFLGLSKTKNLSVKEQMPSYTASTMLDLACNMLPEPGLISSGSCMQQYRTSVDENRVAVAEFQRKN